LPSSGTLIGFCHLELVTGDGEKANEVNDDDDMNTEGNMMNREKSTHEASTQKGVL
jgi:hypothetical protein